MASWSTASPATMRSRAVTMFATGWVCRRSRRRRRKPTARPMANGRRRSPNTSTATRTASPTFSSGNISTAPARSSFRNFTGTARSGSRASRRARRFRTGCPSCSRRRRPWSISARARRTPTISPARRVVVATTASEGASAKWAPELTQYFKDRRVVILPDADEPGRKHAQKVAKALYEVAASIKVVDLFPDRSDGHDVSDWLKHDAVGAKLFEAIKAAPEWQPGDDKPIAAATPEDEALLAELAALSPLDYAKRRKRAATKLGISVSDLDRFVAPLRDEKKFDKTVMLYDALAGRAMGRGRRRQDPVPRAVRMRQALRDPDRAPGHCRDAMGGLFLAARTRAVRHPQPGAAGALGRKGFGQDHAARHRHLPDPPGPEQRRDQRGCAVSLDRQMAADLRDRRGRRRSDRQRRSAQRPEFRMDPRPDRHPLSSRHPRARNRSRPSPPRCSA